MAVYTCNNAHYRRNNGTWWAPLSGGVTPTGWTSDGGFKYETRLSLNPGFDSIRANNVLNYIVSAKLWFRQTNEYSARTVYAKITDASYATIAGGASAASVVNGWASITLSAAMLAALVNANAAYIGTYGAANNNYIEIYADATNPAYLEIVWASRTTACGAPTSLAVNTTLSEGNITLSWSGATGGINNAITGMELQYCDSADGINWGEWQALSVVAGSAGSGSLSASPPSARGNYRKFRARTRGAAGSSYYSGWKESTNTLRKNRAPGAPTVQPNGTARPESIYSLVWTAATDPDGHTVDYLVSRGVWNGSAYDWLPDISVSALQHDWDISGYPRGQRLYMVVKAKDSLGAVSDAAGNGVAVYRNQLPVTPSLAFPAADGAVIYNTTPRIGLTMGADADGDTMAGRVAVNGVLSVSDGANQGYWSRTGRFSGGTKAVVRGASAPAGARTVQVEAHDGKAAGGSTIRSIFVIVPTWTDGTLTPGETKIKAAHIAELRAAINNIRAYYGLAAVSWTDAALTVGTTKIKAVHITEMRTAIEQIISLINAFDGTNNIHDLAVPTWTDATLVAGATKIKAAHIAELRAVIPLL